MTNSSHLSPDDLVDMRSTDFTFARRERPRVSDQVEEFLLNLTLLHEVDILDLIAQIINDFPRLESLLMEMLTDIDDLCEGPVSHDRYPL